MENPERIHFVTGRLAEKALTEEVNRLSEKLGFQATVEVLPISVAALMTPRWIAGKINIPPGTDRVIVPGYCEQLAELQSLTTAVVETGPRDLRRLAEYFGLASGRPEGYGDYDIEIIAEINHAPDRTITELLSVAQDLVADGADVVDVGCKPGITWSGVGDSVAALVNEGIRVSIDSLNPIEIAAAASAGAELVLSVNATNRHAAADWGCEVVVIPDRFEDLQGLEETIYHLEKNSVRFRIDPILEPIGFGFSKSLGRYLQVRELFPQAELMMGIGNLSELTDCDSSGVNTLLLGFCQELAIGSVLTTQVINWARTSVKECDLARRLVHHAVKNGVPPKHLEPLLIALRDPKVYSHPEGFIEDLTDKIKDQNYRIFTQNDEIHLLGKQQHFHNTDPFEIFDEMLDAGLTNLDASHSFYLGYEMCKAMIANQLGKEFNQDQALNWGYLTQSEKDRHRLSKRKRKRDAN
jgi:dihydropteroate synthase-like protein